MNLKHSKAHSFKTFTIASTDQSTQATFVPARGGAASSIIMPGHTGPRELLYLQDFFWDKNIPDLPGGWPFCFPICGRLKRRQMEEYLYQEKLYRLPIHGFSWQCEWEVEHHQADAITLVLRDTPKTKCLYPFSFQVTLSYEVKRGLLRCKQHYHNRSATPMPYYAGFHPYFLTPPAAAGKEKVLLDYKPIACLKYTEDLCDLEGNTSLFDLPTSITNPAINEQLTRVKVNQTFLKYPNHDVIEMQASGPDDLLFPYVQLWTQIDKPFFCIEPWMGHPNALNSLTGARWLAPKKSESGLLELRLI